MLLGVPPLYLDIKGRAANSAYRLSSYGQWKSGTRDSKIPLRRTPIGDEGGLHSAALLLWEELDGDHSLLKEMDAI